MWNATTDAEIKQEWFVAMCMSILLCTFYQNINNGEPLAKILQDLYREYVLLYTSYIIIYNYSSSVKYFW